LYHHLYCKPTYGKSTWRIMGIVFPSIITYIIYPP
jgi:hypothetical protein